MAVSNNEFALIDQKLRVYKEESHNLSIKIKDDTGLYSLYNPGGYGDPEYPQVDSVDYYLIYLEDQLDSTRYIYYIANMNFYNLESMPGISVEAFQNGVPIILDPEYQGEKRFKDSFYKISLFSSFYNMFTGDGFEGQDFITNVQSANIITRDYTAIIVGEEAYRILDREGSTIFLDREIIEDFNEFSVGFYDEEELVLFQDLEDCILKGTLLINDNSCGCFPGDSSREDKIYLLAEAQLYMEAARISLVKEDLSVAREYMELAQEVCNLINCK